MSGKPTGRDAAYLEKVRQQEAKGALDGFRAFMREKRGERDGAAQPSENTGVELVAMARAQRTRRDTKFRESLRDMHDRATVRAWLDTRQEFAPRVWPELLEIPKDEEWVAAFKKRQLDEFCDAWEASQLMWVGQDCIFDYLLPTVGGRQQPAGERRREAVRSVREPLWCLPSAEERCQAAVEKSEGERKQEEADGALVEEVD